ncbi:TIGR04372 family glycosyltransferase [Nisaea sp.]|uniref:TIGR04372 family glycosyltransferase n=1 Tax=Nisaea sp. TaxID=2024842 RepID=UPI0032EB6B2C
MEETPRDRVLREELADPQRLTGHLARLLALLQSRLDPARKCLVYVLAQQSRIGHLVLEPWMLQSLFGDQYDEIVIVTGPGEEAANKAFFDYLRSRFTIIETDDIVLTTIGFVEGGSFSAGGFDFLLWRPQSLFARFTGALAAGLPHRFFTLSEQWLEPGRRLRAGMLPEPNQPYVMLHVRDEGFAPEMGYHGFRCNPVGNYRSAVEYLLGCGLAVIRIGDAASPRLDIDHPCYIELSHSQGYDRSADLALLAESHFGIVTQSGPWAFLQALGRPILLTNAYPEPFWVFQEREVALYKHVRRADGTELTYRELWECEIPDRILTTNKLSPSGLTADSNSAAEIRAGVEEMLEFLAIGTPPDPEIQRHFHAITREYDDTVKGPAADRELDPRLQRRLSRRFLESNPHFLD